MTGLVLAVAAFAATAALFTVWKRETDRVAIGDRLWLINLLVLAAVGLGIAAFASGPGWIGGTVAGVSVLASGFFGFLGVLAPQSKQAPAVAVGDPMLDFTALDENGKPFELASLKGRPVLLKFFRGHW